MITLVNRQLSTMEREHLSRLLTPPPEFHGDRKLKLWLIVFLVLFWIFVAPIVGVIAWLVSERAIAPCVVGWLPLCWGLYWGLSRKTRRVFETRRMAAIEKILDEGRARFSHFECREVVDVQGVNGRHLAFAFDDGQGHVMLLGQQVSLHPWPVRAFEFITWEELHMNSCSKNIVSNDSRSPLFALITPLGPSIAPARTITVTPRIELMLCPNLDQIFDRFMKGAMRGDTLAGSADTLEEDLERHFAKAKL